LSAAETEGFHSGNLDVRAYVIEGNSPVSTNALISVLSPFTGTNIGRAQLVRAASALQAEYGNHGYPMMSVVIGQRRITNGIVTFNVFEGAFPQIVVSGQRCVVSSNGVEVAADTSMAEPTSTALPVSAPAATNAGPRFEVQRYQVAGNTVLAPEVIGAAMTNATAAFGTNVSFGGIQSALTELQQAYRARGYVTVSVGLPQQKLTNATVKVQVTEGRLAAINVTGNRYFSSNNIARALPSLHADTILNGLVFQAELNRANASQDRQIYPVISPGAETGTSDLTLKVKDRLPLHAKIELNNQSSPGTPDLRINTSAVYNNLWQLEHSVGLQYSFSPEVMKSGNQWALYDVPLVANYSAFYRMPLGSPPSLEKIIESQPGSFGYSEATRKFNLPPPSGLPELNLYASRAVIDTGVQNLFATNLVDVPGVRRLTELQSQQDITINEVIGFRYTQPFVLSDKIVSSLSGGLDFKHYSLSDHATNAFQDVEITYDENGNPITHTGTDAIATGGRHDLKYLPLSLAYNLTWQMPRLTLSPGLGISANLWYSGTRSNLQGIAGTTNSVGHWVTLTPSLSADFVVYTNWVLSARLNGQWANEPLISNEQFGGGGVASVRGYHEGEVFGDTGWHVSLEQQTPAYVVGLIAQRIPLTVRGSIYTDYADTYLLEPHRRPGLTALWGTGLGGVISVGSFWDARILFSVPLLNAGTTRAYQPLFNFSLTGQF
jgi:hemolysin activation/secretion protein